MSSKPLHVLIIGAGIGGLTLAQGLRKRGISFEVFERDASREARPQGYALGLYDLDGLFCDSLPDDIPPLSTTSHLLPLALPSQIIYHFPRGQMMYVEDSAKTPCLRANRDRLRDTLSTGIAIRWGKSASRIEEGDERVTVIFEDGTSAWGDILVGADGTFSTVRPHVLNTPNETILDRFPATVILGETKLSGAEMEQQLQLGHSCAVVFGTDFVLLNALNRVQVDGDGKVSGDYYWIVHKPDQTVGDPNHWQETATAEQALEWAREKVGELEPPFREAVEKTGVEGVKHRLKYWDASISKLPLVKRVLLIGDAAHPIAPTRGEGAILAIRDAVQLSAVLGDNRTLGIADLRARLNEFQQEVVSRGYAATQASRGAVVKARAGNEPPIAWGHRAKVLETLKPLPINLTAD
ncbi:FAD-dependent urate hydroxylase [Madurella mycetomatis]|uniref:FAD-dependent urate hydroxylase n=1 Tax=Madurella mycetomatis TaxID=100816 RepID=A0A175W8V3_9PEZI|nr:FAD-dependent urate hydroxylase [Madurella mycetomatis]